jgi:hypothetical protein
MPEMRRATFREDPETSALLDKLSARLGLTRVGVLRLAVRRLAQIEGVELERGTPEDDLGGAAA